MDPRTRSSCDSTVSMNDELLSCLFQQASVTFVTLPVQYSAPYQIPYVA
jgi:hypothetical protein